MGGSFHGVWIEKGWEEGEKKEKRGGRGRREVEDGERGGGGKERVGVRKREGRRKREGSKYIEEDADEQDVEDSE